MRRDLSNEATHIEDHGPAAHRLLRLVVHESCEFAHMLRSKFDRIYEIQ